MSTRVDAGPRARDRPGTDRAAVRELIAAVQAALDDARERGG